MTIKIGELAVEKGVLSREQLREALLIQKSGDPKAGLEAGAKLGRILLLKRYVYPMVLVRLLCDQAGAVDFLYIGSYVVEPKVADSIPKEIALKYKILPLVSIDKDTIIVASNHRITSAEYAELSKESHHKIEVIRVSDSNIEGAIVRCYDALHVRGLNSVRIGEILVRDNYLSQKDLDIALEKSSAKQRMLGKILIETGKINERDFFQVLAAQRNISLVSANDILPLLDRSITADIPKVFCLRNLVVPYLREDNSVYIVTAEPYLDSHVLKQALHCDEIKMQLATYSDVESILRSIYAGSGETFIGKDEDVEALEDIPFEEEMSNISTDEINTLAKRFQKVTSHLLLDAINKGASDIHIEVYEKNVLVRFRIDGTLYDMGYLPVDKKNVGGIVNVLKIQSNMNIAERRLPQSGRFRKRTEKDKVYDFRLQSQPTLYGENMVIRILSQSSPLLSFDNLGFTPEIKVKYERLIKNPSGLILITGPTGSGKTTTLYSTLGELRKDRSKKIITVEDPIEYSLENIQQTQVKNEIGYTFDTAIKAFLREDPDIILVGEVRDPSTALEAMRASQTGHLVFSTLHTNNTIESVRRLLDLETNPGTIASELLAILSQRLAKKNCVDCKTPYRPSKDLLDYFYPTGVPKGLEFYHSSGCSNCNYSGHKGRVAVIEFWITDSDSKALITQNASYEEMYADAVSQGMIPMVKDALMKVELGLICLEELPEIIPYSEIIRWREELKTRKKRGIKEPGL